MTWVDVTIDEVVQETPLDRSFVLRVPREHRAAFAFTPGQYVRLRDPTDPEARDWYFSLSGARNEAGSLRITVRGRGEAVQGIYAARAGATWRVVPPTGDFGFDTSAEERIVLAGAGSGVTPFRAFLEQHEGAGPRRTIWLLHSARQGAELLFHGEFQAWSDAWDAFSYRPTITGKDADWDGREGRIDEPLLREALGDRSAVRLFACGPEAFVDAVFAEAEALGLAPEHCCRQ
jgi:ferredoxin-NADP reductase